MTSNEEVARAIGDKRKCAMSARALLLAMTALLPACTLDFDGTAIEGITYRPLASNAVCSTLPGPFGEVTAGPINVLCCSSD